ncbi:STAS domain-containing protein [Streptomyces pratensis]|uniref:STAS domain-containing protein n=1 Tax=Streptomyces pratensis TaxID=1169025 RepID=UPI00301774D1
MAAEHPSTPQTGTTLEVVAAADGGPAVLVLTGVVGAEALRELEEVLEDPQLAGAAAWAVDMRGVTHIDLACAYALLRAATLRPEPAELTVRGAGRAVQRTLRRVGLDAVAVIDER